MKVKVGKINAAAFDLMMHVGVAAGLFIVVSATAVGLNSLTVWVEHGNFHAPWVVLGMRGLEMLIWALDLAGVSWLLIIQFIRFGSQVWDARKD